MSSSVSAPSGVVVVTQVCHEQSDTALGKFLKGEPLGIVQIMIGVINILFGIPITIYADSTGVHGGIVFWGGLIYIASGALTVAANKKFNKCLLSTSLRMNFCSMVVAGGTIGIFSIDLSVRNLDFFCQSYDCEQMGYTYQGLFHGIVGVLLVFSILQFIISFCVLAFACRAICGYSTEQVVIIESPEAPINTVSK
ncbi:membrane-spanning 4-domains subfamily A member 4A-like [Anguilla rostrata]|uniref:membrane-spanning 4-domains subfamily A member 4A-like n=1 Tax=Anguilla rostrata TaxID=7938 RepID=UPI0030D5E06E